MRSRLFMGQLSPGDFRARISQPGFDASDPTLDRSKLQFDTLWPFAGNIHSISLVIDDMTGSKTVSFPQLPFVPQVLVYKLTTAYHGGPNSGYNSKYGRQINATRDATYSPFGITAYDDHADITFSGSFSSGVAGIGPTGDNIYWGLLVVVFRCPARLIGSASPDPSPVARLMIGKRGTDYGVYASRAGLDVRTAPKNLLTFDSDNVPINVRNTITGSFVGSSSTATDNINSIVNFSYSYPGYLPLILPFFTVALNGSNQWYYLPQDRAYTTNTYGKNVDGNLNIYDDGTGVFWMRYISTATTVYYSLIILDIPLPS